MWGITSLIWGITSLILVGIIKVGSKCVHVSCIDPSLGVADNEYCMYILQLTCISDVNACDSDGVTYATRCHFAKAYCANAKVTFVRDGTCLSTPSPTTTTTTTTTPSPPTQSSSDVLKEVFCNNQQAINCQTGFNVVCGSDGNLYPNPCEFSKAVCNLSGLTRMPDTSTCYPL
ncbi:four-domain proteases inhibitor-like isoform X1 [Dreissena polymorpha]|uniref:Kazal-like domain-containing protein n=1 Tax=Dreissena polymorpha TaxID=45954 RepID=A0A9D4RZJ5_DREPO|nr:four-domain proteases inhibitor-like isoform X1 [Dreissena polymorpha]KAH3886726.1 hypothetical protein DPMN_010739 [Dreissena polymorpha]